MIMTRFFKSLLAAVLSGAASLTLLTGCDLFGPQQAEPTYGGPAYSGAPAYDNQPIYGQPAYGQQPYGGPGQGQGQAPAAYGSDAYPPGYTPPQAPQQPQGTYGYGAPGQPAAAPAPTGGGGASYTVQSGDTLWEISRQYQTTVTAIKQANGLTTNTIHPGQTLVIP